jgi:hypothetical protein
MRDERRVAATPLPMMTPGFQVRRGLVRQDQGGPLDQGPGDGHPLLLAA